MARALRTGSVVLSAAVLTFACLCLYFWGPLHSGFYADDLFYFDKYSAHAGLDRFLSAPRLGGYFRPLAYNLYLPALFSLSGLESLPYHVGSLLLHWLACWLFWLCLRRIGLTKSAASFASLLWGFSIIHSGSLAWVSGCSDLLANALVLGSTLLFLTGRRTSSAALYGLACLSKESAAPLPLALAFLAAGPLTLRQRWVLIRGHVAAGVVVGAIYLLSLTRERFWHFDARAVALLPVRLLVCLTGTSSPASSTPLWVGAAALCVLIIAAALPPARPRASGTPTIAVPLGAIFVWCIAFSAPIVPVAWHLSAYYWALPLLPLYALAGARLARVRPQFAWPALAICLALSYHIITLQGASRAGNIGMSLGRIAAGKRFELALRDQLPRLIPRPASGSLLVFDMVPALNGFVMGDSPFLRLLYKREDIGGCYLGSIADFPERRRMYFLSWDDAAGTLALSPDTPAGWTLRTFQAELSGRYEAAEHLTQLAARVGQTPMWWPFSPDDWVDWNQGYQSLAAGRDRDAAASWGRASARRELPRSNDATESFGLRWPQRCAYLITHPMDADTMLGVAAACAPRMQTYTGVFIFRAAVVSGPGALRDSIASFFHRIGMNGTAQTLESLPQHAPTESQ